MKALLEFLPVVLFFLAYRYYPDLDPAVVMQLNQLPLVEFTPGDVKHKIYFATLVLIAVTTVQVIAGVVLKGKVDKAPAISLALLLVLGGMTIAFRNPMFLIWKVTILYWVFATVLLGYYQFTGKTLMDRFMSQTVKLSDFHWQRVNIFAVLFFVLLGLLNLAVAYSFSEETWVNFKLFGLIACTFAFLIGIGLYINKHGEFLQTEDADAP